MWITQRLWQRQLTELTCEPGCDSRRRTDLWVVDDVRYSIRSKLLQHLDYTKSIYLTMEGTSLTGSCCSYFLMFMPPPPIKHYVFRSSIRPSVRFPSSVHCPWTPASRDALSLYLMDGFHLWNLIMGWRELLERFWRSGVKAQGHTYPNVWML